jgi:hypothetical protein
MKYTMLKKVVKVTKEKFETESGNIYPIVPPFENDVNSNSCRKV